MFAKTLLSIFAFFSSFGLPFKLVYSRGSFFTFFPSLLSPMLSEQKTAGFAALHPVVYGFCSVREIVKKDLGRAACFFYSVLLLVLNFSMSFTQQLFEMLPRCLGYSLFTNITERIELINILFIHSTITRYLGCFQFGSILIELLYVFLCMTFGKCVYFVSVEFIYICEISAES